MVNWLYYRISLVGSALLLDFTVNDTIKISVVDALFSQRWTYMIGRNVIQNVLTLIVELQNSQRHTRAQSIDETRFDSMKNSENYDVETSKSHNKKECSNSKNFDLNCDIIKR